MRYLIAIFLISNISYGACIDIGIMQSTAQSLKTTYKAADAVIEQIIKQINSDEDSIFDNNDTSFNKLKNIQNLDSKNTLNMQGIFFNSKIINDLQSNLIDSKGESINYKINKDLEEIIK
ncbi:hypothetical protein [Helicobacter sp. MIT 14-3879]|uniref:hypothetical protein n=1 Tax=Helicobacter sp. MIT 14-3879 TaxID=2040649 RepID=UPI000E1ECA27|nr:hypothetical protein [Helicobacter sp. MIT 14-3879]RDU61837.1 hypothetical protein CQA44_07875 [Helicobacter sp. MIT 14-3879]